MSLLSLNWHGRKTCKGKSMDLLTVMNNDQGGVKVQGKIIDEKLSVHPKDTVRRLKAEHESDYNDKMGRFHKKYTQPRRNMMTY